MGGTGKVLIFKRKLNKTDKGPLPEKKKKREKEKGIQRRALRAVRKGNQAAGKGGQRGFAEV